MLTFLFLMIYSGGAWMASRKADRVYSGTQKWLLVSLWPLMLATNPRFRQNFRRPLNK